MSGKRDFCRGGDADTGLPCMLETGHVGPCDSAGWVPPVAPPTLAERVRLLEDEIKRIHATLAAVQRAVIEFGKMHGR